MAPSVHRVVVAGATGAQGGAVVNALLADNPQDAPKWHVVGLTRDKQSPRAEALRARGVEMVNANLDDVESLKSAFESASGVFVVTNYYEKGTGFEGEIRQVKNVIEAAKHRNVAHVVFSSVGAADKAPTVPHFQCKHLAEEQLKASLISHTILRPVFFMDNFVNIPQMVPDFNGRVITGLTKPATKLQQVATADIGAIAAKAFAAVLSSDAADKESYHNKTIELAGDELDGQQLAAIFDEVFPGEKKKWTYRALPVPGFILNLVAHELHVMSKWFEEKGFDTDIAALKKLHPGLLDFKAWLIQQKDKGAFPPKPKKKGSCLLM